VRNLISLADLTPAELGCIVTRAAGFARDGVRHRTLTDRQAGIYFRRPSTRTRTSFWAAATRLGAGTITFGPGELQLTSGETLEDTSRVLGQYLDALVIRTNADVGEMRRLGTCPDLAVINALSLNEHPTQAIADLSTLTEHFGGLAGRHLLVVGEGNSTGAALALAGALTPELRITLLCPDGYQVPKTTMDLADELAGQYQGGQYQGGQYQAGQHQVRLITDPDLVEGPVDAIYASRWQTMGEPKTDPHWLAAFEGFSVDRRFFDRYRGPHTIFMHDLPAVRGQEVTDEILDGECSLAWRQAYHKMTAAMAILEWCVTGLPE
jgi:ornithine carbamoyltransferase